VLDLDLLVHAAAVIDEPGMTIPHPGIAERNFVLLPLLEIAPELVIPGLGRVVAIPVNWDEPSISRIA
jgi:2-amino-4-hydroxy-6-hydroxymethyldihydropteridine diphosphokinase